MGYSVQIHDKNFTVFKVYVINHNSVMESVVDRYQNDNAKLRADRNDMLEAVHTWCTQNDPLYYSGYKVRFDQKCGCSCGCSPGFRVTVNGLKVRNSGYTQLLRHEGRRNPKIVWLTMDGKLRSIEWSI